MTKGQSYTAIGAVLLAGSLFHGSLKSTSSSNLDKTKETASIESSKPSEGPWLASCRYWAAVRPQPPAATTPPTKVGIIFNHTDSGFNATITGTTDDKADCGTAITSWGIPDKKSKPAPEIHAILATVPDPIHSHLALEFDRSIDSLLQAAADNGYLASSYWLPWRSPSVPPVAQPIAAEHAEERKAQDEPGLIILKYNPGKTDSDAATTSFYRVIYLFVVGESPAQGMNGKQLRNALEYENQLREVHNAGLSMESPGTDLAFIGPRSSGSAASLRQAILSANFAKPVTQIIGAGLTSTEISQTELNDPSVPPITYFSFGEDTVFEEDELVRALRGPGGDTEPIAILAEDNTVFGEAYPKQDSDPELLRDPKQGQPPSLFIRFPREISLLRNAKISQGVVSDAPQPPSPYLNLSLKDPGSDDTIPKFSTSQTPLSQEAQLMTIERQLQKARIRHILITASNVLDEIFLARELRRACPNATIVFYNGGDLLVERDVDNVPYIGSITVSPHSLVAFDKPKLYSRRVFSDSQSAAVYNAASYILWWGSPVKSPRLADTFFSQDDDSQQFPLMVSVVGADGYYPLGFLSPCASHSTAILPNIGPLSNKPVPCPISKTSVTIPVPSLPATRPSMFWFLLCAFLFAVSVAHVIAIYSASYWSSWTRDLAIGQNDQPRRRALYVHIAASMLVSIGLALTIPWFTFARHRNANWSFWLVAVVTLSSAVIAAIVTLFRTYGYWFPPENAPPDHQTRLYPYFHALAAAATVVVLVVMLHICRSNQADWGTSYVGLFFSYRCLHPVSGVSPVVPLLFLLFAWYLWATFQTARLRFSTMNRPRLPGYVKSDSTYPLYVTDGSLQNCSPPIPRCLLQNIDALLITRELVRRFTGWDQAPINLALALFYLFLFFVCALGLHIESLGRFLHPGQFGRLTPYEWLIAIFFYPLIMVALTSWLRILLIWSELKDGLLANLERMPFRRAFSRFSEVNWVTMLGQSGLNIRWRDMSRSTESVRQIMNNAEMRVRAGRAGLPSLQAAAKSLTLQIEQLLLCMHRQDKSSPQFGQDHPVDEYDLPIGKSGRDLCFIYAIEQRYATFSERLLEYVLIPYWNERRIGFVNERDSTTDAPSSVVDNEEDPLYIKLAEEFLVIRYVAFIRAALVNIRHLMLFVSMAFVFAIVGWNSFPFQPRQTFDWYFTVLMLCLGAGFVWIFAQMHRDPILSRITATTPNELGSDFYLRLITFGAVPVLTWLAYQFPEFGGSLLRLLQPSLQVAK